LPSNPTPVGQTVRIHDIQGRSHVSSLLGQAVVDVPGVVTAVMDNRF
jgi:predicted extracellular nuclease